MCGRVRLSSDYSEIKIRLKFAPDPLEPVSGQVGRCFPGKVILGGRDRTAVTSVEAQCEKSRDQVDPVESANTGLFGAAPGNLRRAATDWWSNEDSNQGPGQFYRRRAIGSVRDRGRSRTPPAQ